MLGNILALALFASSALSASISKSPFAVKSSLSAAPKDWVRYSRPDPSHPITLRFALTQPNFAQLEEELYTVSDPSSPRWTEHLSKEEVESLIAPSPESLSLLDAYLAEHGIDVEKHDGAERTAAKDWLMVPMTVAQAERFLDTEYFLYKHRTTGKTVMRTTAYSLPKHLHDHIEDIQPTNYFGVSFGPMSSSVQVDEEASDATTAPFNLTLKILKELYHTDGYKPAGKGLLGVTGLVGPCSICTAPFLLASLIFRVLSYLEQYANLADLAQYYQINLGSQAAKTKLQVELVNGKVPVLHISKGWH